MTQHLPERSHLKIDPVFEADVLDAPASATLATHGPTSLFLTLRLAAVTTAILLPLALVLSAWLAGGSRVLAEALDVQLPVE